MGLRILETLADDKKTIPYRKNLNKLTGGPMASILLTQIIYWWDKSGKKPFYKFKVPPQRKENESDGIYYKRVQPYRKGDSWCEELGFTYSNFDTAIKTIARRSKEMDFSGTREFIVYWKTRDNLTYYDIKNPEGLDDLIDNYRNKESSFPEIGNQGFGKHENPVSINNTEISNTEITINPKIRILGVQAAPEFPPSDKPLKSKPTILKRLAKRNNSKIVRDKFHNKEYPLPKEKAKPLFVPKSVQDIIDYWNSCGLRQHKDPTSKIYREIVKRVKLVLRNKFDMEEFNNEKITPKKILLAIDHFKLSATDLSYEPWNKDYLRRLSLFDFFYNIRSPRIKSQFIYCLDPPRPIDDLVVIDEHPEITEEFKKQYVNKVLGGVKTSEFTNREENCFKKTAKMMLVFFHKYGDRMTLTPMERKYPINLVEYIFAALDKRINEDWTQVTPGWFAQPSVYSKTLPAYLYNQAIIEEPING